MDPTIQTPAEEARVARIEERAAEIVTANARIAKALMRAVIGLRLFGKPALFQNKHYDWDDVVGLLKDMAPTPNAEQARAFVAERESGQ